MEKIDAIEMVRKIRDSQYEETKDMSRSEYLKYVNDKGGKALEQIKHMAHERSVAA
jgi:hypothetical protein